MSQASATRVGRITGMLLPVQMAGLIVPFILLHPLATTAAGFPADSAGIAFRVKLGVFLLLANCALTIAIALVAWPVVRSHSETMALLLVALGVIMFTLQAVDDAHLMSILALLQLSPQAGGGSELSQSILASVRSTRKWVHYSELVAIDAWIFTLHLTLYRFTLVPRPLAVFGLITVVSHFLAIPVPLFLGYHSLMLMGMPMALSHLAVAGWLIAKGFPTKN